jgi:DoxX-like protein
MNFALWIVTGLLAVVFLVAAVSKLMLPNQKLAAAPGGAWVEDFSPSTLKTIGALEILGVAGLILPAALDIAPVLVPLAAVGLALVMVGAIITRLRRHEGKSILVNVAYPTLAGLVAWGRFGPESF